MSSSAVPPDKDAKMTEKDDEAEAAILLQATQEMLSDIIGNQEVAGPMKAPGLVRATAPPRTPKRSRSPSSSSSSSSSSYYTRPSRNDSRSERRRRRAGPPLRAAMILGPPPPPQTTPMEVELDQENANKYKLKLEDVTNCQFFDLKRLETALCPDMTTITNSAMTVWLRRKRNDMKKLLLDTIHGKMWIYADENTFILRPPKQRRRRRGAKDASLPQPATKATPTGETTTEKIAWEVSVVLAPTKATRTLVSGAQHRRHAGPHRTVCGATPGLQPRPRRQSSAQHSAPSPPHRTSCRHAPNSCRAHRFLRAWPAPCSPVAERSVPVRAASPASAIRSRAAPTMSPEWARNKGIVRLLRSVATLIDAPQSGLSDSDTAPPL